MTSSHSKDHFSRLAQRMRAQWDRRVEHDYRYWMSDGVTTDEEMWETGRRDFAILLQGLPKEALQNLTALEIGCGVGRLLRAAAQHFGRVIGVDVSQGAISQARRLLADLPQVEARLGSGVDLSFLPDASVDFAFTFAALSSMPISVIVNYLAELARVLKPGGILRLQVYLGKEQDTREEDTIAIRSFSKERFFHTLRCAGFEVDLAQELVLPFEVSNREEGTIAYIVGARHKDVNCESAEDLAAVLVERGEKPADYGQDGSYTEYLMAVARAKQHMEEGNATGALEALRFAVNYYADAEPDVCEVLAGLEDLCANAEAASDKKQAALVPSAALELPGERKGAGKSLTFQAPRASAPSSVEGIYSPAVRVGLSLSGDIYQGNLKVIRDKFPLLLSAIESVVASSKVSVGKTPLGHPVISYQNLPLSHLEKPERAGDSWAERSLNKKGLEQKQALLVVGFGDGYYLRSLQRRWAGRIHVVEPQLEVLKAALGSIDLRALLQSLSSLSITIDDLKKNISAEEIRQSEVLVLPQTQALCADFVRDVRRMYTAEQGFGRLRPSVAVMGPMYGGSLPIARYTARAFSALKQRSRLYDFAPYMKGFTGLSDYLRTPERRNVVENQYVELMSQVVLEGEKERPMDILICLAQAPISPRVLTELRARGVITVMWFVEDCRRFDTWKKISPYFDYMFLLQKGEVLQMVEAAGAGRAIYLPVGCEPETHRELKLSAEEQKRYGSDISFVGAGYNNRRHLFALLALKDFKIWGTEWPACLPFTKLVQNEGRRVEVEEYVKVFNASKINLNLHSSSERDGVEEDGDFVNPRTFELAAAGAFQLVDRRKYLAENFLPNKEVAVFSDEHEMLERTEFYLAHPEERQKIVEAGRQRALAEHTYVHRVKKMLEYIYADRFEELKARVEQSPWARTFDAAQPYPELSNRLQKVYDRGDEPLLSSLAGDIQTGKGALSETEQLLLFMHHVKGQISYVRKLRKED